VSAQPEIGGKRDAIRVVKLQGLWNRGAMTPALSLERAKNEWTQLTIRWGKGEKGKGPEEIGQR